MRLILSIFFKNLYSFLTNRNYRTFVRLVVFNNVNKRYSSKNINFNNFKFTVPDMLSFVWQYNEIFFKKIFNFNTEVANPVIFDCGANVGLATAIFKQQYPNAIIEAFEPDSQVFNFLKSNIEYNFEKGVVLNEKAVWIKNEVLEFSSEGADAGSVITDVENVSKLVKVEAIDFKEKIQEYPVIHFLKMDIEGAENEVIPHIKDELYRVQNFFLEFHAYKEKEQNLGEILQIFKEAGFRYYIENVLKVKSPFLKKPINNVMDIQLNIFAFRK